MSGARRAGLAIGMAALLGAIAAGRGAGQNAAAWRPRVFVTRYGGPALQVVARARTRSLPKSVNVSPDGRIVVVCNFGQQGAHNVSFFDALSLTPLGEVDFPGNAVETVFSADGTTLYVSNFRRHVVEVVDVATRSVRAEIAVGRHPKFMALSSDGATLYVANWGDRSVSVVDVAEAREVRRLPTERHPRGLAVRPDGTLLAAAFHGDVIHVFPAGADAESERWETCAYPRHLLLSPDGETLYVTCSLGHVGFYDAQTGRRLGLAPTGRNPRSIGLSGNGRWIGVANFSSSDVSLIDTVERRHRTYTVPGASRIVGLAMHPGPQVRLYATSWDTNELYVLADSQADAVTEGAPGAPLAPSQTAPPVAASAPAPAAEEPGGAAAQALPAHAAVPAPRFAVPAARSAP
jgi:YVTN family beta-propeller protein